MSDILPANGKLGKHSVYVWGAVLGVGLLAYMWYQRRSSANTSAPTDTTTQTDPTLTSGGLGSNTGQVNNSGISAPVDTSSDAPEATNQTWEQQAIHYLTSLGVGGETAQQAIEQYLSGYQTSYQQHLWLNKVIAHLGPPPEGVEAIPGWRPKPKPKPATAPPRKKRHKVKPKPKKKNRRKIKRRHHKRTEVGFR